MNQSMLLPAAIHSTRSMDKGLELSHAKVRKFPVATLRIYTEIVMECLNY